MTLTWSWWPCFSEGRGSKEPVVRTDSSAPAGDLSGEDCRDGEPFAQSTDIGGSAGESEGLHEELTRGMSESPTGRQHCATDDDYYDDEEDTSERGEAREGAPTQGSDEDDQCSELDFSALNSVGSLALDDIPFYRHVTAEVTGKGTFEGGRSAAVTAFGDVLRTRGLVVDNVEALYRDCRERSRCALAADDEKDGGRVRLIVRSVSIRLLADIFGVEHSLFQRLEMSRTGKAVERRDLPTWSLQWKESEGMYDLADEALNAEVSPYMEDLSKGCRRALRRLGLSFEWQEQHLEEDVHLSTFHVEPERPSVEHPGCVEVRAVHEVVFRVAEPTHPAVRCIGLPMGQEFATTEGSMGGSLQDASATVKIWAWGRSTLVDTSGVAFGSEGSTLCRGSPIKRVPIPTLSGESICRFQQSLQRGSFELKPPSPVMRVVQEGRTTDWDVVERMSRRIRDSDYTLDEFYHDLCAFPELDLYLLENNELPGLVDCSDSGCHAVISGRTIGDEYQRTVGAFFAIYWLMRLGGDGRCGFCFGVDEHYRPIAADAGEDRLYPAEQRLRFYREGRWELFDRLLRDAGLLVEDENRQVSVNSKRVATVLALTAIHDVMKVKALLPTVAPEHENYHGYLSGESIGDHDHALSYVMDHFPELLPSFRGLDEEEQRSVQFTQCELCFNHGWLVQAEAPPGAIFKRFRQVLASGKDSARDIALYFVHWLTDLAGAEPTPLGGSEKFVLKFPLPVLNSFLNSFQTVQRIATETETEVMEGYLLSRWSEHTPSLGPPPTGPSAIAKMRLLCMAQMNAVPILEAFDKLSQDDRDLLSSEMAMTACEGQTYSSELVPEGSPLMSCGPAFLVYYGPAFLQSLGSDSPVLRLRLLAEIYAAARKLWPAAPEQVGSYVTVRIDAIRGLSVGDVLDAERSSHMQWAVVRKNGNEAFVDQVPARCRTESNMVHVNSMASAPSEDDEGMVLLDVSPLSQLARA